MRFSNNELDSILSEALIGLRQHLDEVIELTMQGSVLRNDLFDFRLPRGINLTLKRKILLLCVAKWYSETYLGGLHVCAQELTKLLPPDDRLVPEILLSSKVAMLTYLTTHLSDDDLFGNLLPQLRLVAERISYVKIRQKRAREVMRRRGHRDHGTLPDPRKKYVGADWSLTEEQNRIEALRQSHEDTFEFLRGFLE